MTIWLLAVPASAATVELAPSDDTMLCEATAESNGAGTELFVGSTGEPAGVDARRALLAFDLAQLPAGSTVTAVELDVVVDNVNSAAATPVNVHAVNRAWVEGTSFAAQGQGMCATAVGGDATWFSASHPGVGWTSGGDFDPSVLTSVAIASLGPWTFSSTPALVADVQSWADDPAFNFGWILRGDEVASTSAKRFGSRENANPPVLRVTFDPGPLALAAPIPGSAGANNTVAVTNALPGDPVYLVYGVQAGPTAIPGCPGATVVMANPVVADFGVASGAGAVVLGGFVPGGAAGRQVVLQVVQPATCALSAPLLHTF